MNYYSPAAANAYANPPGPPASPYGASPAMLPSGYRQTTYYRGPGDGYADDNAGYQGSGAVPPQNAPCLPAANPQPAFQGRTFQQPAEGTWVPKWQPYAPPQQPVQAPQANGNVAPAASSYLPAGPAVVQTRYESGESWGQTQPLQGQSWAPVGPGNNGSYGPQAPQNNPLPQPPPGTLMYNPPAPNSPGPVYNGAPAYNSAPNSGFPVANPAYPSATTPATPGGYPAGYPNSGQGFGSPAPRRQDDP